MNETNRSIFLQRYIESHHSKKNHPLNTTADNQFSEANNKGDRFRNKAYHTLRNPLKSKKCHQQQKQKRGNIEYYFTAQSKTVVGKNKRASKNQSQSAVTHQKIIFNNSGQHHKIKSLIPNGKDIQFQYSLQNSAPHKQQLPLDHLSHDQDLMSQVIVRPYRQSEENQGQIRLSFKKSNFIQNKDISSTQLRGKREQKLKEAQTQQQQKQKHMVTFIKEDGIRNSSSYHKTVHLPTEKYPKQNSDEDISSFQSGKQGHSQILPEPPTLPHFKTVCLTAKNLGYDTLEQYMNHMKTVNANMKDFEIKEAKYYPLDCMRVQEESIERFKRIDQQSKKICNKKTEDFKAKIKVQNNFKAIYAYPDFMAGQMEQNKQNCRQEAPRFGKKTASYSKFKQTAETSTEKADEKIDPKEFQIEYDYVLMVNCQNRKYFRHPISREQTKDSEYASFFKHTSPLLDSQIFTKSPENDDQLLGSKICHHRKNLKSQQYFTKDISSCPTIKLYLCCLQSTTTNTKECFFWIGSPLQYYRKTQVITAIQEFLGSLKNGYGLFEEMERAWVVDYMGRNSYLEKGLIYANGKNQRSGQVAKKFASSHRRGNSSSRMSGRGQGFESRRSSSGRVSKFTAGGAQYQQKNQNDSKYRASGFLQRKNRNLSRLSRQSSLMNVNSTRSIRELSSETNGKASQPNVEADSNCMVIDQNRVRADENPNASMLLNDSLFLMEKILANNSTTQSKRIISGPLKKEMLNINTRGSFKLIYYDD